MPNNSKDTQINPETVKTAISGLTDIENNLSNIQTELYASGLSLVTTWTGTAKASFLLASTYARKNINRIMLGVSGVHNEIKEACEERVVLDQNVATAATIKE